MGVSAVLVRVVVEAVERAGLPRDALLAAASIDARRLAQVQERFELRDFTRIQECALDLTRDEALALHIAEERERGLLRPHGARRRALAHAPRGPRPGLPVPAPHDGRGPARAARDGDDRDAPVRLRALRRPLRPHARRVRGGRAPARLVRTFVGPRGVALSVLVRARAPRRTMRSTAASSVASSDSASARPRSRSIARSSTCPRSTSTRSSTRCCAPRPSGPSSA